MNATRRSAFVAAALFGAYVAVVFVGNRMRDDVQIEKIGTGAPTRALAGESITLLTWNLGYGGLGAESDFSADGGKHLLPPSRKAVDKNIAGITAELRASAQDIIIMQEAARPSLLTRGADIVGAVGAALNGRDNAFSADFSARFLPRLLRPQHGLFSSVNAAGVERETILLPLEPGYIFGVTRRLYHMHVIRLPGASGGWTVIDIHLSAFDDGANVRLVQLRSVMAYAEREYERGRHVIIGGDWNFEFARPDRPTTTDEKFLFWVHPFPYGELGKGWRAAVDPSTPSVRTNERPYVKGQNFTTVIDGFVISPNVRAIAVTTHDLDFQYADHQPVSATFMALDPDNRD